MQLRKYRCGNRDCLALQWQGQWLDLSGMPGLQSAGMDMLAVLADWSRWKSLIEQWCRDATDLPLIPVDAVPLLPFQPCLLRDFMLSEQHAIDAARGFVRTFMPKLLPVVQGYEKLTGKPFPAFKPKPLWYRQPLYYFGNHLNLVTDGDIIEWPSYTEYLDYELELAFVLAKPLRNASPQQALDAIGGFLVLNDVSARDVQMDEMRSGFGPQKAKHFLNGLSSTLTTADAVLPQVNSLRGGVRINGVSVCETSTANLQHSIADVLVHASRDETLHPGEVFATGTLPGGCGMENGHWLKPGDELELWIEGVGSLRNSIGHRSTPT